MLCWCRGRGMKPGGTGEASNSERALMCGLHVHQNSIKMYTGKPKYLSISIRSVSFPPTFLSLLYQASGELRWLEDRAW